MSSISQLASASTPVYSGVSAASQSLADPKDADVSTQSARPASVDQATFSSAALALSATTSYASPLFPTRTGMSADALMMAVANPGLASSSKGLTFEQVAADARVRLDDKYARMSASGAAYADNSPDGRDTNSLVGDLDRRSLYAVSSNAGGLFSKKEQQDATSAMDQQLGLAMGFYSGSIDAGKDFVDPYKGDDLKRFKVALNFLDHVSREERSSPAWLRMHQNLEDGIAGLEKPKKPEVHKTLFDLIAEMNAEHVEEDKDDDAEQAGGGTGASDDKLNITVTLPDASVTATTATP